MLQNSATCSAVRPSHCETLHYTILLPYSIIDRALQVDALCRGGCFNPLGALRSVLYGCLGAAAVRRRTRDRKVTGSTPGRRVIKSTTV